MRRLRLIYWNQTEAKERAVLLRAGGYAVDHTALTGPPTLRALRADPPAAVVIDLSRLPAQGRDLGIALRLSPATRRVPLVFVDGAPEKVDGIRRHLPDAVYTTWARIAQAVGQAIAHAPASPVVPRDALAGYAGASLVKKLGIKAGIRVGLIGAPRGFEETLGTLPDGVTLTRLQGGRADLVLWFTTSRGEVERNIDATAARADGEIWIMWPKRTSAVATDLSEPVVRRIGLASGLVDYKVCAVDATWSGLRFARRKRPSAATATRPAGPRPGGPRRRPG